MPWASLWFLLEVGDFEVDDAPDLDVGQVESPAAVVEMQVKSVHFKRFNWWYVEFGYPFG